MTFSVVARCPRTAQLAVGAVTAEIGVGKLACHALAGAGAVATQATTNPYLAYDGLRLLSAGRSAAEALAAVLAADPGAAVRQCAVLDAAGGVAVHTGDRTLPWSGHLVGEGWSAQGNRLVGGRTLEAVARVLQERPELELVERVLAALEAGERTGADRDGALSATVTVVDREEYPLWDLRVDHHEGPVEELRRLHVDLSGQLMPVMQGLPTRDDPMGRAAREQLEQ